MMSFFEELKRRNVVRVGFAYAVAAWLLIQVTDIVFPRIGLPDSAVTLVIALLAIGFLPALIFAWAFELTPEGIKREHEVDRGESITHQTGKKLDRLIIAALVLVVGWFLFDEFYLEPREGAEQAAAPMASKAMPQTQGSLAAPTQQSVAVLPFRAMSSGEDDEYFADGLTEEILNSLTALPELLVTARTSSFHFKDQDLPIPEIAAALGVAHVVEGSVRRSGEKVRITAQLIRAGDGFHLWSDTYDRTLEDVFAVQEEIATNIAGALDVVMDEDKRAMMRQAGIGDVDAFIAYQKGMEAFIRAHSVSEPMDHLPEANRWFDQALAVVPDIVDAAYLRTDLWGHLLIDYAGGMRGYSDAQARHAVEETRAGLSHAMRAATNEPQRAILAAEHQMFTDDWTGIQSHLETAFTPGYCNPVNWMVGLASPFGRAAQVAAHQEERERCDPLANTPAVQAIAAQIWNGQAEEALARAESHLADNGFSPWVDDMRYVALQATGKYMEDSAFFGPTPEGSSYAIPRTVFAHALTGDLDEARRIYDEWLAVNEVEAFMRINALAYLGDFQAVNALAAEVDGRTGGFLTLQQSVLSCFCGAPFDLEATPNFKARITEAGFDWPPTSPIQPPAKDW